MVMQLNALDGAAMGAFAGEHSSVLVPGESSCHRRTHVSPE